MVDIKKVTMLVDRLRQYVLKLKELGAFSEADFLKDAMKKDSARLNLQYALETCLDLTNHLISRFGFRAPKDYADSFKVLVENGVVTEGFLTKLRKMAKMRNRLVHLYWETDDKEIYSVLKQHLSDFELFAKSVLYYLAKREKA